MPRQHDSIADRASLDGDEIVELRVQEHNAPLLQLCVEETDRCADLALLLAVDRVCDPEVLHCAAVENPAEQQLTSFMTHASVTGAKAEIAVPRTHEAVESASLRSQRRTWVW